MIEEEEMIGRGIRVLGDEGLCGYPLLASGTLTGGSQEEDLG